MRKDLQEYFDSLKPRGRGRRRNKREGDIAVAVAKERLKARIPTNRLRTPEYIFALVAKSFGSSKRSVERYYAKNRDYAHMIAQMSAALPEALEHFWKNIEKFSEVLTLGVAQRLRQFEKKLKPSEIPQFEYTVRRILARKSRKQGK